MLKEDDLERAAKRLFRDTEIMKYLGFVLDAAEEDAMQRIRSGLGEASDAVGEVRGIHAVRLKFEELSSQ